jgi:hypothetical protein
MTPVDFPESNVLFGPPPGIDESQCKTVHAYTGLAGGGSMDGSSLVVTAWKPEPHELEDLNAGKPIFLTFVGGGLPPHMATTDFKLAISPR